MRSARTTGFFVCILAVATAFAGQLTIIDVEPAMNSFAHPDADIVLHFDRPVDEKTVTSANIWAYGRASGVVSGLLTVAGDGMSVTLSPADKYAAGEVVTVIVSNALRGADLSPLRSAGYSFQFTTRAMPAAMNFQQIDVLSTNVPKGASSRPYGGIAMDADNDDWLDLVIVNEDTFDLRVFLNTADGSGLFDDFLQPTFAVGVQASPSDSGDFNRDGNLDVCVANIASTTVSILLGNGDGTFGPQQQITVGSAPRGIVTLDADGDGDLDVVNCNYGGNNMSVLLNDGSGVFGAATFFEGGSSGERALATADMNEDGILDLIIGAQSNQRILVNQGNGDGTFTNIENQPCFGSVWMVVVGDLNGDRHIDVTAANSGSNNGAVLLGDGTGNLGTAVTYGTDPFCLATDLGDLDGDNDLDWILASFGGDWSVYLNNGDGTFTFDGEFPAPAAASCSIAFDSDNDGDLDLALVDEIDDVVILLKNVGSTFPGDMNCDGALDAEDIDPFFLALGSMPNYAAAFPDCYGQLADVNGDGAVDAEDIDPFFACVGAGGCP